MVPEVKSIKKKSQEKNGHGIQNYDSTTLRAELSGYVTRIVEYETVPWIYIQSLVRSSSITINNYLFLYRRYSIIVYIHQVIQNVVFITFALSNEKHQPIHYAMIFSTYSIACTTKSVDLCNCAKIFKIVHAYTISLSRLLSLMN